MLQYWVVRLSSLLLQRVPLRLSYLVATFAADIVFLLWRRGRDNMLNNMSHVLGSDTSRRQVRWVARRSLRNYGKYLVDYFRFPTLKEDEVVRRVNCPQWDKIEELMLRGKGTLLVGMHMGNWDFGPALMCQRNYPVSVVVEAFPHQKTDAFVKGIRTTIGMKTIPMERAARGVLQALRKNHFLGILIDRPSPEDGVSVRFFGAPTKVPAGPATLALRTGASIATVSIVRMPDDSFVTLVDDSIAIEPTGNFEKDVQELTQRIMDSLENMVRSYPEQWYMFRAMWQSQTPPPAAA